MGQEFSAEDFRNFNGFDWSQLKSGIDKFDTQLEQLLGNMTRKLSRSQSLRSQAPERMTYCRRRSRTRDGAPAYMDDSFVNYERDKDGFPVPASPEEVKEFDAVFFGKSPRSSSSGNQRRGRGLRSRSIPDLGYIKAKFQKIPAPSKPKFLERIITGGRKGSARAENNGLIEDDVCGSAEGERLKADDTSAHAVCLSVNCDSEGPDSLDGETDCSEESITPTNSSLTSSPPFHPRTTWSTPNSPLRSGIVQKRCENFQRLYNAVHDSPPLQRKASACTAKKGPQSTPTSPLSETKSGCFAHKDQVDRFDKFIKNYYSISRDERFAKSVMSKGYVRALVERINNSKPGDPDHPGGEDDGSENEDVLDRMLEQPENISALKSPKSSREKANSKPKLTLPNSKSDESCVCKNGKSKLPKTSSCDIPSKCECDAGYNNGCIQPMSPAELFDSSWSESDLSFDDYTDEESDPEDKLFETFEKKLEQTEVEDGPPRDRLYRIADELLKTERAYVQRLHLLHQVFNLRIQIQNRSQNMLPTEVINQMFSNIESIYQFHHDFLLPQLEERMSSWDHNPKIGDLMKQNAPFLKLYTDYVKNFDNAMNLINTWTQKCVRFDALIKEIQQKPECGSLSLQHHMLEPIQRVPRYEMLLKDYIKVLPPGSPDHTDAQAALNLVTTAAKHSNEAMKKIEKFRKLLEIHQSLRPVQVDFISPTRELIREGSVTKISARSGEKQFRYIFLLNDMMLICSEPLLGTYRVRAQLDVDGMQIRNGENLSIANTFCVMSRQKAIELLDHETSSESSWYEIIERTIEELKRKKKSRIVTSDEGPEQFVENIPPEYLGKRAPRWVVDDAATMCMRCESGFSAFKRKHHCRACGWVICSKCSRTAPLQFMKNKQERVCDKCYDIIVHKRANLTSPESENETPKKSSVLQVKASDPAILAGYLYISSDKGRTWAKRWFAVHDDFVMYSFKAHQDVSALTSMPLPGHCVESVAPVDNIDRPNTFKVHHKNKRIYFFQTDHDKHLRKWVSVLEKMSKLELPDESQRLSSQSSVSNISSNSGSGDMSEGNAASSDASSTHSNPSASSGSVKDSDSGIAVSNENCSAASNSELTEDTKEEEHS